MTEPTEAEVEAARWAIAKISECIPAHCSESCYCREEACAALTAAAQVRQNARVAIVDECEEVFRPSTHRLGNTDSISAALTPIYSAAEDHGSDYPPDIPLADVLGIRKDG